MTDLISALWKVLLTLVSLLVEDGICLYARVQRLGYGLFYTSSLCLPLTEDNAKIF
jgi:hypothetical protein